MLIEEWVVVLKKGQNFDTDRLKIAVIKTILSVTADILSTADTEMCTMSSVESIKQQQLLLLLSRLYHFSHTNNCIFTVFLVNWLAEM